MNQLYTENWEQRLDTQFLKHDSCKKRAYICSPLSAGSKEEFLANMRAARAYMYYAMEKMGYAARAPHAYLPALLCDRIPAERALALRFGLSLLENSEIVLVCGNRLSKGMRGELAHAAALHIPVLTFDEGLYLEVQKEITANGGNKKNVRLDRENFLMAFTSPVSYLEKAVLFT